MSQDLSLAQNHAWNLARTLMVPVILFKVDDEYGVMPADELDDAGKPAREAAPPRQAGAPLASFRLRGRPRGLPER